MAEEKEKQTEAANDSTALYYGVGAAVLVLLVAGIYLLRPKPSTQPGSTPAVQGATGATLARPTGAITGLTCEIQYYNPVIGLKQYYLSAEGSDVTNAKTVNCDFSVVVAKKEVAKPSVSADLKDEPTRSGKTFKCATPALALDPNIPTTVNVALADDLKKTATCSATFLLPPP